MMDDPKKIEASNSPKGSQGSQPTPFSIADILSREIPAQEPERRQGVAEDVEKLAHPLQDKLLVEYTRNTSSSNPLTEAETHFQTSRFPRFPSPELNMARELDILRRNLAQANLTSFGSLQHLGQGSFKHLETLGTIAAYQQSTSEARDSVQRQQDEALDMSKSKLFGKLDKSKIHVHRYSNRWLEPSLVRIVGSNAGLEHWNYITVPKNMRIIKWKQLVSVHDSTTDVSKKYPIPSCLPRFEEF